MSVASSAPGTGGFLNFNNGPPKIFMTDSTPHPPEKALLSWKEEGYEVTYFQYHPSAQPAFIKGVLLLHSFEYEDAAAAFRQAQRVDPSFALAYWGEAMTHFHQLLATPAAADVQSAQAELAQALVDQLATEDRGEAAARLP